MADGDVDGHLVQREGEKNKEKGKKDCQAGQKNVFEHLKCVQKRLFLLNVYKNMAIKNFKIYVLHRKKILQFGAIYGIIHRLDMR